MPKKQSGNFIKFLAAFVRVCRQGDYENTCGYAKRQYTLLRQGIRDVRISDTAIYGWEQSGGQW